VGGVIWLFGFAMTQAFVHDSNVDAWPSLTREERIAAGIGTGVAWPLVLFGAVLVGVVPLIARLARDCVVGVVGLSLRLLDGMLTLPARAHSRRVPKPSTYRDAARCPTCGHVEPPQ
jgi:hypothetical protein